MKTKPILFSTPMVQAILEGRKTQTRRLQGLEIFNKNPDKYRYDGTSNSDDQPQFYEHYFEKLVNEKPTEDYLKVMGKVKPGDIFWVRETFAKTLVENDKLETEIGYIYKADEYPFDRSTKWKPSIFMPKEACRIFLKVTRVRSELLRNISTKDAIEEGVEGGMDFNGKYKPMYRNYLATEKDGALARVVFDATTSFRTLWCSINGADNWIKSPWVWVYEFERTGRPKGFI